MDKTKTCKHGCDGSGIIFLADGSTAECKCIEIKRTARLFKSSQITPIFASKTFESFNLKNRPLAVRQMYNTAYKYAINFRELDTEHNWLMLLGEPGAGKTHLAIAASNYLIAAGIPVLYLPYFDIMGEIKDLVKSNLNERIKKIKNVALLVWDDLFKPFGGEGTPTPFEIGIVFDILNYRYFNGLPVIISSERLPKGLLAMDKALGSRMLERAKGHLALVEGIEANYRL